MSACPCIQGSTVTFIIGTHPPYSCRLFMPFVERLGLSQAELTKQALRKRSQNIEEHGYFEKGHIELWQRQRPCTASCLSSKFSDVLLGHYWAFSEGHWRPRDNCHILSQSTSVPQRVPWDTLAQMIQYLGWTSQPNMAQSM